MTFKPMLASPIEDTSKLRYPVLVSPKYDGIRAVKQDGVLVSRSLKDIPNKNVQALFDEVPDGIDGELIYGDPVSKSVFQDTTSIVMSHGKPATGVKLYVFDYFEPDNPHAKFSNRHAEAYVLLDQDTAPRSNIVFVKQTLVRNEKELLKYEEDMLDQGFEGVMVRDPEGPYKQGRSSLKQGWLLKLKRFVDAEAKILGFYEELENQNEAKTNALGRTERSTAKAGLKGKNSLGGFDVIGINGTFKDVEFGVGSGLTADQKAEYWKNRQKLVGKVIKYKYFPIGTKDKPRLPIFLGFRDKADM